MLLKKILIIVPDGVGIRNYLYSSFIDELTSLGYEIYIYHQVSDFAILEIKKVQPVIKSFLKIPVFIEKPFPRLLRESIAYARLLTNKKILNNESIMMFWAKSPKKFKLKILYRSAAFFGWILSKSYKLILKCESVYTKTIDNCSITNQIKKDVEFFNPDIILNLHQRAPVAAPIIAVANKLNIKTATVIFSWDNVPKARLVARYDKYFVWSELMKNELELLYSEIEKNQIKVVGTPQFEFYLKKEFHHTKIDFFEQFGLDISKKTICFSANDLSSPYEADYFSDICEAVFDIEISIRPQIIFRKNPVDRSNRFAKIIEKYKNFVFEIEPDWRTENSNDENFVSVFPCYNDLTLLVNTVLHSDLVINLGSTMAHDFAVLNKPCLYLNYDTQLKSSFPVKKVYSFQHFRSLENLDAVGWINSKFEIKNRILNALLNPEQVAVDRLKWIQKIINHPLDESSKNLASAI